MKIECDQKGGVKMEESHNFYLNDYTEFVKQATDIIESNKNSKNYVIMYADLTNFQLVNDFYGFIDLTIFYSNYFVSDSLQISIVGNNDSCFMIFFTHIM